MTGDDQMDFDPLSQSYQEDPYRLLRTLQDRTPFHYRADHDDWLVLRHSDVAGLAKDFRRLKSSHHTQDARATVADLDPLQRVLNETAGFWDLSIPNTDPPQHGSLRKVLKTSLNNHFMADVQSYVTETAAALASGMGPGEQDLVRSFSRPLMNGMIAHLFDVPEALSLELGKSATALAQGHDVAGDPAQRSRAQQALFRLYSYFQSKSGQSVEPASAFVQAIIAGARGQRWSNEELYAQLVLLYAVAQTTTQDLISSALLHLLQRPDLQEDVNADLGLVPGLITETLRYEPPVQYVARRPHEPIELFGQKIHPGQRVILMIAAAHHDPRVFNDPGRFDIRRNGSGPLILAFGGGIHRCIGMHVAPTVAGIALEQLLKAHPRMQLADGTPPRWQKQFLLRGLESLPMVIDAGTDGMVWA